MKNDISVTPVKKYTQPKYPTQTDAKLAPELLRKLPARWQKNAAVVAAAGLFGAITLTSCGILEPGDSNTGYNPDSENFLNVAPVFIHGEGTGAMGCVMIAPPVFLSEQEALAIIKSIAETEGLNFSVEPPGYTAVKNEVKAEEAEATWLEEEYLLGGGQVGLDLYDSINQVAVTYISMERAAVGYNDGRGAGTVTFYRPRELAELTADDFARQNGDINIGIFYEPGKPWENEEYQHIFEEYRANMDEAYEIYYKPYIKYDDEGFVYVADEHLEEYEKKYAEALSEYAENIRLLIKANLRAQVRDFIEWLQGQGII